MDFAYTPQQEALRRDVREFIKENVTDEVAEEIERRDHPRGGGPRVEALFKKIHAKGWLGITYPKEYGGQGGDRITRYIVEEEFLRVGIPSAWAAAARRQSWRRARRSRSSISFRSSSSGEFSFALGFTEPHGRRRSRELRCTQSAMAIYYIINGQKMYTTTAHVSTHIYLMARTNRDLPKHEGISIFLSRWTRRASRCARCGRSRTIPTARTERRTAHARTNETFFDDVRVHKSCLLGEENKGWRVGSMGLNLDRVGASRYLISVRRDEDIVNFVKRTPSTVLAPGKNPAIRDKIAELWIEAQVCRLMTMRSMSIVEHGGNFTYEGLRRESVGAGTRGAHHRGDHADARALRAAFQRLAACHPKRFIRAQRVGRFPIRDQSRQRASHA